MLTFFTIPKAFRGPLAQIQRNAVRSWMALRPTCELLLFGKDAGTAELALEFKLKHIPDVECNQRGTPLVSSLFEQAQQQASHELLCYVNADILLLSDFLPAVQGVAQARRRFLMGGRRWDIDFPEGWELSDASGEQDLRALVRERGRLHGPTGIDYFVFPRGLYETIPPFAIGRRAWDNWLLFAAWRAGAALVDASAAVCAVHQNHDYAHVPGGAESVWEGPEARRNLELAGSTRRHFTLEDAEWRWTGSSLIRSHRTRLLRRRVGLWLEEHPALERLFHMGRKEGS